MVQSVKKANPEAEAEEEAAADTAPVCYMPDLLQDNKQVY